jgi:prophage antirepressor-like protein
MNELQVFKNQEFGEIRTLAIKDEPWFVGKDVAEVLGYKDTSDALKRHVDSDDKLSRCFTDSGQSREMYVINESGLYSLILSSKLPKAKEFKHWVTSEVLPSIRKTGSYSVHMTDYQKMMMETRAENVRIRKAALLNRIADQYSGTFKQVLQAHATKELTGEYLLPLPEVGQKTYSAGEIGQVLGISGNMVGRLAIANNLKTDQYGVWCNDKAKGHNKEIPNFRYFESVIPVMQNLVKTEKSNN